MHVLVTGAAGFIGSHLVERLLGRGEQVTGLDNFDPFYAPAEKHANLRAAAGNARFRLITGDLTDPATLAPLLPADRPDVIVHLAAKAGVRPSIADPAGYVRANVAGTQAVLDLARRLEVGRLVFASSSSVYGNAARVPFLEDQPVPAPVSPYAATKRAGELLCTVHQHLYGGSVLCLRFFTVYGPRQRPDLAIRKFCTLLAAGRPIPVFGDGSTARDYTWIDDIMAGVLAAVDRGAAHPTELEIINLGGSRTTELRRLVQLISEALDVRPAIDRLPPQPGDVERTWADVSKARRLLGYDPATPIEEGIPRFVDWFRAARESRLAALQA